MKHQPSLFPQSLVRFGLAAAVAVAPLALAQSSVAQERVRTETAEETISGPQNSNPFSSESGAGGLLELMQQLNRGPTQSWSEFNANQREHLGNEASDFRARQLELIKQQAAGVEEGQIEENQTEEGQAEENQTETEGDKATEQNVQSTTPDTPYRALW